MIYLYCCSFNLVESINPDNFDKARGFLLDDNMTSYLKDDGRIPLEIREAVDAIEWQLTDEKSGHVELRTTRALSEEELQYISNFVSGQNSDGLGEVFEQQSFAEVFDEERYEEDHRAWQEAYDEALDVWDELDDDAKEEYGNDKYNYAEEMAYANWGAEPETNSSEYNKMASFNWMHDDYVFTFVEEFEG